MSEQLWWYATRAAGLMTWTTATTSVVLGLMLSTRAVRNRTGPWFLDLHRFLGGISVVFLAAHLATLWADSYIEFGPKELFVPGAAEFETEAMAWGIVAAYLLVAIQVSSLLRKHIGTNLWRAIHFTSFAAMIGGSYHAYLAGSDVENPITWAIAGIGSVLVMGLISMRLQRQDPDEPSNMGLTDNRAILEEMRKRLEDLPIPEGTPQPQISLEPNPSLPRRAPVSGSLPGIEQDAAHPENETIEFSQDPFDAVPLAGHEPEVGDWAKPSPADPFAEPSTDPFRLHTPPTELPVRSPDPEPAPEPALLDRAPWADDGADLFDAAGTDPFEALGVAPTDQTDGFPELPPLEKKVDLFSTALPTEPGIDFRQNPFAATVPTPSVIEQPAAVLDGPPPLPDAIDPETGEPDEAAYRAWLKDWLVFAERYGDEAPEDPSRS